ncbi:MAG: hypothetical protein HQ553_03225 [Chloroflexi bacterium]|nr:hypothetical protein [Chloroflexota bacterium]
MLDRYRQILLHNIGLTIGILLSLSLSLWFLTIADTKITTFDPDSLHYAKHLPVYYWIGMGLNCIVILLSLTIHQVFHKGIWIIHSFAILILVLYIIGTPSFIYDNPSPNDVYVYSSLVDTIGTTGHAEGDFHYLEEFPGSTIFTSMIVQVFGVTTLAVEKYAAIFIVLILSLIIYALAKGVLRQYAVFAPITSIALAFVYGYHLVPQNIALLLTATLLMILVSSFLRKRKEEVSIEMKRRALIILLWMAIIVSHPSTPILNLFAFVFMFAILLLISRPLLSFGVGNTRPLIENGSGERKTEPYILIYFFVAYMAYIVYAGEFMLESTVSLFQDSISDLASGNVFNVNDQVASNPLSSYTLYYYARWFEIIGISTLGLVSILILFCNNNYRLSALLIGSFFVGYIFLGVILVASGEAATDYGTGRILLFACVPCSILFSMVFASKMTKLFKSFRVILLLFILTSSIAVPLTRYGNHSYNFMSDSEFAGLKFVSEFPGIGNRSRDLDNNAIMRLSPFSNNGYCLFELKQQKGGEYTKSFKDQHKLYDSGQCRLYKKDPLPYAL